MVEGVYSGSPSSIVSIFTVVVGKGERINLIVVSFLI